MASLQELAERHDVDRSYVSQTTHLASLAPDIVEAVLAADEPGGMSLNSLGRELPLSWDDQRGMCGLTQD